MKKFPILILGATGMLGHTVLAHLSQNTTFEVYGTVRNKEWAAGYFPPSTARHLIELKQLDDPHELEQIIWELQPGLIINCIGIIKQIQSDLTDQAVLSINTVFPHRLACLCRSTPIRIIQISTDCVYDGKVGNYNEQVIPRPADLYGLSKYLGELDYPHCLTLRTSIIGHELRGNHGLLEWFLSQPATVKGYTKAIYSGLPTVELAEFIGKFIIYNPNLTGIYHLSAEPISKYELLSLIKETYNRDTVIEPADQYQINRSLDSARLRCKTGYQPPEWPALITKMYRDYCLASHYQKLRIKE